MKIDEKYLPDVTDQIAFYKTRIEEGKKHILGGKTEIETVANHSGDEAQQEHTVRETEYQIKQVIKDIDFYESKLDELGV